MPGARPPDLPPAGLTRCSRRPFLTREVGDEKADCPSRRSPKLKLERKNGAQSWNRTSDTAIFSRMLYQLSYLGIRRSALRLGW